MYNSRISFDQIFNIIVLTFYSIDDIVIVFRDSTNAIPIIRGYRNIGILRYFTIPILHSPK